jgi:phosphoglycolate phosphatase-like HAD superfamily hydrolase
MMHKIKLVVFDMAGTTMKDKDYVGIVFQQAMQFSGNELSVEKVNPYMGYKKPVAPSSRSTRWSQRKTKYLKSLLQQYISSLSIE